MTPIPKKHSPKQLNSPEPASRDPTVIPSFAAPTTSTAKSKKFERIDLDKEPRVRFKKRFCTYLFNREEKTFCGRTCLSWLYITMYSVVYLVFLTTYTLICLYCALSIVRLTTNFQNSESLELLTYADYGVGLSATPTSESNQPIIWYRKDHANDYQKYVRALDNLLVKRRRKQEAALGPCGVPPYGYGDKPCVILRINKDMIWSGRPLELNSTEAKMAPLEVQNWLKKDKKLWFHCSGYNSYDKEHIGRIQYYPDPPGLDPNVFPLGREKDSPLVAMQISNFTLGMSLAVECKLWYAKGPSSVAFVLYVASDDKKISSRFYI